MNVNHNNDKTRHRDKKENLKDTLIRLGEENAHLAYITFRKHIKEEKDGLFCFFEGKDSPYYIYRIREQFKGNYYPITCGGKSKVLKVYELINYHSVYDNYKKAFFVDKDFDASIKEQYQGEIYETPCYSIENFYVEPTVFAEILKSEFLLAEVDESFKKCLALYQARQLEFHQSITLFNAWYACLKDYRNQNNTPLEVNLSDELPKGFISIKLDKVIAKYDLAKINQKFPKAPAILTNILQQKISTFVNSKHSCIFRGKYELDFLYKILEKLIQDANATQRYIQQKINYTIIKKQMISQFSQYALTPDCLVQYIEKILTKHRIA